MTTPTRCILLVGGHGTRLRPLTATRPKHLLPVGGVPMLDLLLDRLVDEGVTQFVLAVSVHADRIGRHIAARQADLAARGVTVRLSRETTPLGTGGAIAAAARQLDVEDDDAVLVVNGDLLTAHDLAAQSALLTEGTDLVLHVRPAEDPSPFGTVVRGPDGSVSAFREKEPGPPGTLVNAGTYVVRARAIRDLPAGVVVSWEREIIPQLLRSGLRVLAHEDDAWSADVGTPESLVAVSRQVALGQVASALPHGYDPAGAVSPRSRVHPGSVVSAGSTLGAGVLVDDGAHVEGSVVLPLATIAADATVVDSVIGEGAVVGAGARLHGCAVADRAEVPPGATPEPGSRIDHEESTA